VIIPTGSLYVASSNKYIFSSLDDDKSTKRVIYVFGWTAENGGWEPRTIIVKKGETVKLVIKSMDMTHGFLIAELGIDTGPIKPGYEKVIELTFDKVGEYIFYCSVYCSPSHNKMTGKIIVVGD